MSKNRLGRFEDWLMRSIGFRAWTDTNGNGCLRVPRWYLWLDPGARKLGDYLERDIREHPEAGDERRSER